MRIALLCLFLSILCTLLAGICPAGNLHVPSQYATISAALGAAQDNDMILVSFGTGTYTDNIYTTLKVKIVFNNPDATHPPPVIQPLNSNQPVVWFGTRGGRTRSNTVLNGFKIQNGQANWGAGIRIYGACSVYNCEVTNCGTTSTFSVGGGIYVLTNNDLGPLISNCQITNNRAHDGAGIFADCRQISIIGCTISGNVASHSGGGIIVSSGTHYASLQNRDEIKTCYIINNSASTAIPPSQVSNMSNGGGVWLYKRRAIVSDCLFQMNTARRGGGILIQDDMQTEIQHNTILGNKAKGPRDTNSPSIDPCGGGIFVVNPHTFTQIDRNYIRDNTAMDDSTTLQSPIGGTGDGGGIYVKSTGQAPSVRKLRIYNNFISNNSAGQNGGGIAINNTYPEILCNSISYNICMINWRFVSTNNGAGIYISYQINTNSLRALVGNTIIWGNSGYYQGSGGNIYEKVQTGPSGLTVHYCNVHGGTNGWQQSAAWSSNLLDVDPQYVGGTYGDLHISLTSPMANAGGPNYFAPPITDYDGETRPMPTGSNSDIGADEVDESITS